MSVTTVRLLESAWCVEETELPTPIIVVSALRWKRRENRTVIPEFLFVVV